MLEDHEDAFGHEMLDYLQGKRGLEVIERDDGFVEVFDGQKAYFLEYDQWPEAEKEAIGYARGGVLDIGCGAGRHALHLQDKGLDVLGVDNSPLAVEACGRRGLKNAYVLSITQITSRLGLYDTLLMMGNNFGLFGNVKRARWLLRRFRGITSEKGRIVAETLDPYATDVPEHLEYHEINRKRGRMPGQVRMRVRYRKYATPWFDYLFVSPEEMREMLADSGWKVERIIGNGDPTYFAIITKG